MIHHLYDNLSVFPDPGERQRVLVRNVGERVTAREARRRLGEWKAAARRAGSTEDNSRRVILSLFDDSGIWSRPFREAGYDVRQYDIKRGDDLVRFMPTRELYEIAESGKQVAGVLAAPPCTSYAGSGARWWKTQHDVNDPAMVARKYGDWAAEFFDRPVDYANTLVAIIEPIVELADPTFFAVENPVGRIAEKAGLPKPLLGFDPYHFGDPYTKRTYLWGDFETDLPTARVKPIEGSLMHKLWSRDEQSGGRRSTTPEGFAYAFFVANHRPGLVVA